MARINVTVPDELKEWLDDQERFSPSGLLQDAIRAEMKTDTYAGIRLDTPSDMNITNNEISVNENRPFESRAIDGHIGMVCTKCEIEAEHEPVGDDGETILRCPECEAETTVVIKPH